jgi:gas vesicle protein
MNNYKMALAIITIAAAGFITGMMIAPKKGSKLRKKVRKKAARALDNIGEFFSSGKEGKTPADSTHEVAL